MPAPSLGRIVIFTPHRGYLPKGNLTGVPGNGATEYVAIVGQVTMTGDGRHQCTLFVMPPFADAFWEGGVEEGQGPRTWRWPGRVE
jgi:hypothetical protein